MCAGGEAGRLHEDVPGLPASQVGLGLHLACRGCVPGPRGQSKRLWAGYSPALAPALSCLASLHPGRRKAKHSPRQPPFRPEVARLPLGSSHPVTSRKGDEVNPRSLQQGDILQSPCHGRKTAPTCQRRGWWVLLLLAAQCILTHGGSNWQEPDMFFFLLTSLGPSAWPLFNYLLLSWAPPSWFSA